MEWNIIPPTGNANSSIKNICVLPEQQKSWNYSSSPKNGELSLMKICLSWINMRPVIVQTVSTKKKQLNIFYVSAHSFL